MMPSLVVRRADVRDVVAVSEVLVRAFNEYRAQYTPDGFAATTPDASIVFERLHEGPIWVAEIDGDLIGTAAAILQETGSLYVRGMAVVPEFTGRGAGAALLSAIEEFAAESRCQRLYLRTTPFLDRAISLYRSHGFRFIDDGPQDLFGTPLLTMEKPI